MPLPGAERQPAASFNPLVVVEGEKPLPRTNGSDLGSFALDQSLLHDSNGSVEISEPRTALKLSAARLGTVPYTLSGAYLPRAQILIFCTTLTEALSTRNWRKTPEWDTIQLKRHYTSLKNTDILKLFIANQIWPSTRDSKKAAARILKIS